MKNTRNTILWLFAGLSLIAVPFTAIAQPNDVEASSVSQVLPTILDTEISDWLKRGDFVTAYRKCSLELESAPLVSEPSALVDVYMCLGEALYGLGRYPESVDAFTKVMEQLEASVGVFDPLLVLPLEGLGKALLATGELEAAEQALSQAKDITHRNFGIFNIVQSSIVNRLTRVHFDSGDVISAIREQNFLMRASTESYGNTPRLLPALRRYAKFQEQAGRPDLARKSYRRAINIMKSVYGTDDVRLAGPLRDFAESYTNTPRGPLRVMSGAGAQALRDVIGLYQRQEFSDVADVAKAWSDLGDWYVIGGRSILARRAYIEAGALLKDASVEQGDLFSKPVEIEFEEIPVFMRRSQLRTLPTEGMVVLEFEFTVTKTGRVLGVTVVRDDLRSVRYANEVGLLVKRSRYRPRILDGVPVDTFGVRKQFRHDFSQYAVGDKKGSGEEVEAEVTVSQQVVSPSAEEEVTESEQGSQQQAEEETAENE